MKKTREMKAKDLRIGNRFKWSELASMGVFEDFVTMDNIKYYGFMEPITLTEEWLLKLGFNHKYKSCNVQWNLSSFYIQQVSDEDEEFNTIPQKEEFYFEYKGGLDIKFVHQLQNLYYALTNEELTVK